jgi:probable phosphoglycerate mutase
VELVLVRHAESTSNVSGRWQGQGDAPLSPHGETQVQALAGRLRARRESGWAVDVVLASDLQRATRTGRAAFPEAALDPAWREADVGAWEGLTRPEIAARFPEQLEALAVGRRDVALGGGESLERFWARTDAAVEALRARVGEHGRALVFTHGGVISGLVARALGRRGERAAQGLARLANTAITTLHFDAAHPEGRLLGLNDVVHLGRAAIAAEERRGGAVPLVTLVSAHGEQPAGWPSGASVARAAIEAALREQVARAQGADVQLPLAPEALQAAVVALAHVPAGRQRVFAEPAPAARSHLVLDPRQGALLVDHATPHDGR